MHLMHHSLSSAFPKKMASKKTVKRESRKRPPRPAVASTQHDSTSSRERDEAFLRRALELAREGIGLTSPNPCVGAVIVDSEGQVAGEGSHTFAGVKHAEVLALEQAGENARAGILYVNLEPCSHPGRTGPCVDAVIAAGIKRVVACMPDPNPVVSGRGFAHLRRAGVQVASGIMEEEARPLNDAFAKHIRYRLPLVTLKAGMTLDGKIAPPPEDLSSPPTLGARA